MANRVYRPTVSLDEPVGLIFEVGLEVRINWVTGSWACRDASGLRHTPP